MESLQQAYILITVVVVVLSKATYACEECDDLTELCVQEGATVDCQCRPSLYKQDSKCAETKSFSTDLQFTGIEWSVGLEQPDSEEFKNLSQRVCQDFNDVIEEPTYLGCDVVWFYKGSVGAIVLSFFQSDVNDTDMESNLNAVLISGLGEAYNTSTVKTEPADECKLNIHDCDELFGICSDSGAGGFSCSCIYNSYDVSNEGLKGRSCVISTKLYIVGITTGTSIFIFLTMTLVLCCVNTHCAIGNSLPEREDEKDRYRKRRAPETDQTPLEPKGSPRGSPNAVANGGCDVVEEGKLPGSIFDVDEQQMSKLARIHLAIERHTGTGRTAVPHVDKQNVLQRLPSTLHGPETRSATDNQNRRQHKQQQRNGRTDRTRLPSRDYTEPSHSPLPSTPHSPTTKNYVTRHPKPTSLILYEDPRDQIYASRLYDQRGSTSPAEQSNFSRQSSSVFLPSSPRQSREFPANNFNKYM